MNPDRAMLIVGAGHAGGRAAQALREAGWPGPIVMIGAEAHRPYERPALSKSLLTGERDAGSCALRPDAAWTQDRIEHVVARVAALDLGARAAVLEDGRRFAYDRLLLAPGGRLRRLGIPGADAEGVFGLRTLDDAAAIAARLRPGAHIAIVGGGFIGLEVAASARMRGCRVSVLESARGLLGRAVPAPVGAQMIALHRTRGVEMHLGATLRAIESRADGRLGLRLDGADELVADTVIVGIGIDPDTELARKAGLAVRRGVIVDARLETSVPGIFAAGDAAEFPSRASGLPMRQETWHNAETQARCAALNMLGAARPYDATPWFWSDQYDRQLQVAGEPALGTASVVRKIGDEAEIHFHLDDRGVVVGMSGFGAAGGAAKELKLARMLVERAARPEPARLADLGVRLKSLL
ncbi:MAG: FAD-dependent oxidoreductase [Burkholderiales bacterium]|nr:FAD-dependent oxidoreductase [Burkholderiales bacterium]MDE2452915.1 FAD-dependent oxidoreductase [Burkholderiales bacterium]